MLAQEQKRDSPSENETRNRALSILSEEPDGVTRELYARRLGERWRLSSKTIMEEVERRRTQRRDDKMKVSNVDYRDSRSPKSMTHLQQRRAPAQTSKIITR